MVFFELFQRNAGKPGFASQQGALSPTSVKMIPVLGIEGVGFGDAFKGQQHRLIGDAESGLEGLSMPVLHCITVRFGSKASLQTD